MKILDMCRHLNAEEFGMSDCRAGCKVVRCKCGDTWTEHRSIYGCTHPHARMVQPVPLLSVVFSG